MKTSKMELPSNLVEQFNKGLVIGLVLGREIYRFDKDGNLKLVMPDEFRAIMNSDAEVITIVSEELWEMKKS